MVKIPVKSYPINRKDVRVYLVLYFILLSFGIINLCFILISSISSFFLLNSIFYMGWGLVGITVYFSNPEKFYLMSITIWKRKKYRKQRDQLLGKGFFMDCFSCGKNFKNQNFNYCPYCGSLL